MKSGRDSKIKDRSNDKKERKVEKKKSAHSSSYHKSSENKDLLFDLASGDNYNYFVSHIDGKQGIFKNTSFLLRNFSPSVVKEGNNLIIDFAGFLSYERAVCSSLMVDENSKVVFLSTNQDNPHLTYLNDFKRALEESKSFSFDSRDNKALSLDFIRLIYKIIGGKINNYLGPLRRIKRIFENDADYINKRYYQLLRNIFTFESFGKDEIPEALWGSNNIEKAESLRRIFLLSSEIDEFVSSPGNFSGISYDESFVIGNNFVDSLRYASILCIGVEIRRLLSVCSLFGKRDRNFREISIIKSLRGKDDWGFAMVGGHIRSENVHAEMKMLEQISNNLFSGRFKKEIFSVIENLIEKGMFVISKLLCLNCSLVFSVIAHLNSMGHDYFDKMLGTHLSATSRWQSCKFFVSTLNGEFIDNELENRDFILANRALESRYNMFIQDGSWNSSKNNKEVKEVNFISVYQENIYNGEITEYQHQQQQFHF